MSIPGLFGPYKVGDHVLEGATYFGFVYKAGPNRFYVLWENGDASYHRQDYEGIRRATFACFNNNKEYEQKIKGRLQRELALQRSSRRLP